MAARGTTPIGHIVKTKGKKAELVEPAPYKKRRCYHILEIPCSYSSHVGNILSCPQTVFFSLGGLDMRLCNIVHES